MPALVFSSHPVPASADPSRHVEGDMLIDVGAYARDWVVHLASLREGRLDATDLGALQSLLDGGEPELALLIAAIARHGAVWIRQR